MPASKRKSLYKVTIKLKDLSFFVLVMTFAEFSSLRNLIKHSNSKFVDIQSALEEVLILREDITHLSGKELGLTLEEVKKLSYDQMKDL